MQIKSLDSENTNYLKKEDINQRYLKNYIPTKWIILSIIFGFDTILMNSKIFASDSYTKIEYGDTIIGTYMFFLEIMPSNVFLILLLISIIGIIVLNMKIKKKTDNLKLKTIRKGFIFLLMLVVIWFVFLFICALTSNY